MLQWWVQNQESSEAIWTSSGKLHRSCSTVGSPTHRQTGQGPWRRKWLALSLGFPGGYDANFLRGFPIKQVTQFSLESGDGYIPG